MRWTNNLVILPALLFFTTTATAQVTILSHVTLIDGTGAAPQTGVSLVIFGTLGKGKAADLLVLEKNPLEAIANMRTIQAIYLGGKKFD